MRKSWKIKIAEALVVAYTVGLNEMGDRSRIVQKNTLKDSIGGK
jgi:hypothetical protein